MKSPPPRCTRTPTASPCPATRAATTNTSAIWSTLLRARGGERIKVFGGGGGVIVPEEIAELERYGVEKIYSPQDGQRLGLQGMIDDMIARCARRRARGEAAGQRRGWRVGRASCRRGGCRGSIRAVRSRGDDQCDAARSRFTLQAADATTPQRAMANTHRQPPTRQHRQHRQHSRPRIPHLPPPRATHQRIRSRRHRRHRRADNCPPAPKPPRSPSSASPAPAAPANPRSPTN